MLKYEYDNAIVYITKPTEKHIDNIKKATEIFMKKAIKEHMQSESRRRNRRASVDHPNAGKRNRQAKKKS